MNGPLRTTTRNFVILAILNIILFSGLLFFIQNRLETSSIDMRKGEIFRIVSLGLNNIEEYRSLYAAGEISKETAIEMISDELNLFTFQDESQPNYVFMSGYDATIYVQPYNPEMVGKNHLTLVDSDGKYIIQELIKQAKIEPGYVKYKFYPPGSNIAYEKISYVVGLPELECYIGTGMYSMDVEKIIKYHFRYSIIFIVLMNLILVVSAISVIAPLVFSVRYISSKFLEIDSGPLLTPPEIDPDKFKSNSDSYRLVSDFKDIIIRLSERNREYIEAAEERDNLRKEHIEFIESTLSEKDIMLKEINHRVKNNLQIIISLLQIQLSRTDEQHIKEAFLETITQLESISMIHNMLYSSENYSSIPAKKYLRELSEYIIQSFGAGERFSIDFSFDNTNLSIDDAVTLGIITNEVITNSVKHAFKPEDKGSIQISLSSTDKAIRFYIADNGTGLPDKFVNGKQTSLGIILIRNLSRQLNGKLSIDNKNGTSYTIDFA